MEKYYFIIDWLKLKKNTNEKKYLLFINFLTVIKMVVSGNSFILDPFGIYKCLFLDLLC